MDFFLEKIFKFDQKQYILCLILIGFLIFFPTFFNGFVWDDEEQIVNNQAVHSLANLPSFFIGSTFNSGGNNSMEGLYYKPLMPTTFAFIYSIFGSSAFFFHLFQVILHILNSILVFLTLQYFLEGNQEKKSFLISLLPKQESIKINSMLFPFILSLFFLLHPINTETVAYISAYQDILFFFFGIVALVLLIKFEEKSNSRLLQKLYKNETLVFFYTFLLLLLSILSKETGALFWGIILLFVVFYKKTSKFNWLAGLVFLPLVYAFLRFAIAKVYFVKHDLMPIMRISFIQRLYTLPKVIFYYLKTLVFPKDLAISQHWVILQPDFLNFYLPLIIILLFFFGLTLYLIHLIKQQDKNWKEFLFFYLWFLIGIIIHSQIIALDMTVAERWFYFPFVGLLGMLGLIIYKYQKKITKK
ncbi:hypothetical protein GYA19_01505, partial [Candidatus Beckwithbacteria bacterium]|nr:hypothetical protein [Candidatus Beckwithbacteria bacterium]